MPKVSWFSSSLSKSVDQASYPDFCGGLANKSMDPHLLKKQMTLKRWNMIQRNSDTLKKKVANQWKKNQWKQGENIWISDRIENSIPYTIYIPCKALVSKY